MHFLALFLSLPSRQTASRMRIWRALRSIGSVTLRDGVYLLPESEVQAAAFAGIADEVRRAGGDAEVFRLSGRDAAETQQLIGRFDRSADYAALLDSIAAVGEGDLRALPPLRRSLAAVVATDFFPGEARRQAEAALAACEAALSGEPASVAGAISRLDPGGFRGRTWATRKHLWVDRMASAWLIGRFIDPEASFLWLDSPKRCPKSALGFDFDGARFTHVGGLVSFEVLAASFGLDADPAIARIAAIVHYLDVGGVPVAEASGVAAVLSGARTVAADDDALLGEAVRVFDNLYRSVRTEQADD